MILITKFTAHFKKIVLLFFSLLILAFTESAEFKSMFDFAELVTRFETLPPSVHYRDYFGIEIEGFYTENRPTGVGAKSAPFADLVAFAQNIFQTHGYTDFSAQPGKLDGSMVINFLSGQDPSRLGLVADPSIRYPKGKTAVEIVSPIMKSEIDFSAFVDFLKTIAKEKSFRSEPLYSGTHIHFDFRNAHPTEVLILTLLLEKLMPEISNTFNIQATRSSEYAKTYSLDDFKKLVEFANSGDPEMFTIEESRKLNISRSHAINWQALAKHGTFEFRGYNSTDNPELLKIQVDLIRQIVKAVRLRDPRLIGLLKTRDLSEVNLKAVATVLGCRLDSDANEKFAFRQSRFEVDRSLAIADQLQFNVETRFNIVNGFNRFALNNGSSMQNNIRSWSEASLNYLQSNNSPVRSHNHYPEIIYQFNNDRPVNRSAINPSALNQCLSFY